MIPVAFGTFALGGGIVLPRSIPPPGAERKYTGKFVREVIPRPRPLCEEGRSTTHGRGKKIQKVYKKAAAGLFWLRGLCYNGMRIFTPFFRMA